MDLENAGLLSQSEIDALLASVSAGGGDSAGLLIGGSDAPGNPADVGAVGSAAPVSPDLLGAGLAKEMPAASQARRYDFRRPDRFSKEQMRALRMIHETWARRIAVSLSAHLRTSVEVSLSDIDQGTFSALSQQLLDQGIFFTLGLQPLAGYFVIHMSPDLATIVVDRLMGGPAVPGKIERRMTDLELDLLREVANRLLLELTESWSSVFHLKPRVDDISQNLMLVPVALPSDAVVWAGFEVRAKGYASGMTLVMPYPALKPIAAQLSPYTWVASTDQNRRAKSSRERQEQELSLSTLRLPVSVVLGASHLGIGELANLQPGDVLPLEMASPGRGIDGLCLVLINGKPKLLARPGVVGRRLAAVVVGAIPTDAPLDQLDADGEE